jgi:hypothetical protein
MRPRVTVAITSVYGGDGPSAGLAAAEMLRRQRTVTARILVLATEAFMDGIQAVHVADRVVVMPPPGRDPGAFVARLRRLARETRRLVLLPGSPEDTIALSSWAGALRQAGVHAVLPKASRLRELPFPPTGRGAWTPRRLVVAGSDRSRALGRPWRYPVGVLWRNGDHAWAHAPADLHAILSAGPADAAAGVYQAVPGLGISVASLGDGKRPESLVAARLLNVSDTGVVWSAVTTATPRLVAGVRRALAAIRWRGPAEARFILDDRGRLWFTGLTPGFPPWVPLTAAAGRDLVLEYVRLALGARRAGPRAFAGGVLQARVSVDRPTTIDALRQLVTRGEISHADHASYLRTTAARHARAAVRHQAVGG